MAMRICIEVLRENQNTGGNKVGLSIYRQHKPVTDGAENMHIGAEGKPEHGC